MKIKVTILVILFFSVLGMAQNSIDISFSESIDLGKIEDKTQFIVTSTSNSFKIKGDKINDFKFEEPGIYHIKVIQNEKIEKDDCGHNHLPNEIIVNVSRIKMTFDANRMYLSEPILKNKETKGTVLSIPIYIETFDHEPIQLNQATVNSAGIGTAVTANLKEGYTQLGDGEHIIKYNLNGTVNQNSRLMFDFIDANGKIQSVTLQTPITN